MQKYSVFISYRRTGFDTANLIAEKLRSMGYSVFFDVESLRGGKFNEQLFQVIDNCTDFVLVLPKDALDRCVDKDDWVRKEVMYAMLKQKNIVPVMLNDFDWPAPMPSGMEDLKDYQAVTASDRNTFDLAMQRLASYLKSSRRNRIMVARIIGIIALVLVLLGILFGVLRISSLPVCKKAANQMSYNMGVVHQLYETSEQMQEEWADYKQFMLTAKSDQRKQYRREDFSDQIKQWETDVASFRTEIRPKIDFSTLGEILLALRGISTDDLAIEQSFIESFCDDIDTLCVCFGQANSEVYYDSYLDRVIKLDFGILLHFLNAYYYSYLSELSHMPTSARKLHREISKNWILFPTESDNQSSHYYDYKAEQETYKANRILTDFGSYLNHEESLNKLGPQLDVIEAYLDSIEAL